MNSEPQIGGLSQRHRLQLFLSLVVVFIVALPVLIFYTTGYRLTFENEQTIIVTTGGVYVTTDNLEVDVYLDEELVERPRLFRSAYYIQNIESGSHSIVVQGEDLHTWVKELPVDPHIVIEASAFNLPVVPQVRPVTEYINDDGESVFFSDATSTDPFPNATTTTPIEISTSTTARVFYDLNEEFIFVQSLFGTSSAQSVFEGSLDGIERFSFATTTDDLQSVATSTEPIIENGDLRIIERGGELYTTWLGTMDNVPYYFCVTSVASSTIAVRYGAHVAEAIETYKISTTTPLFVEEDRLCRSEIRIDRKWMDVYFYNFFPGSSDLMLLQLEDGIYVTEIDDRAWQNTQLLYPGTDLSVVIENESIFIKEDDKYFEVITEIEPN